MTSSSDNGIIEFNWTQCISDKKMRFDLFSCIKNAIVSLELWLGGTLREDVMAQAEE